MMSRVAAPSVWPKISASMLAPFAAAPMAEAMCSSPSCFAMWDLSVRRRVARRLRSLGSRAAAQTNSRNSSANSRSKGIACDGEASGIWRACSMRDANCSSRSARNKPSLDPKWSYSAPLVQPARSLTRSVDVAWYPRWANVCRAAVSSAARVSARRSACVRRFISIRFGIYLPSSMKVYR